MKISTFFEHTLGAHLSNSRWSWGAFDRSSNRLFLRVWQDGIETVHGIERVHLLWHEWEGKSPGFPERKRHIDLLRNGAEGYGVVCKAADTNPGGSRTIADFDNSILLQLGDIIDEGERVFAPIIARTPVAQLRRRQTGFSTLVPDLRSITATRSGQTTKEALANARVGQGTFRSQVLARWNYQCAVTGSATLDAVRASHIKPWRHSNDHERLDSDNGLPLVATFDALFDAGLISFQPDGRILISSRLGDTERETLGVNDVSLIRTPNHTTREYLDYHRHNVFQVDES